MGRIGREAERLAGCFIEVCKRKGMKVNTDMSKTMVLGGEEGSVREVSVTER